MTIDIDELERLEREATPGPWKADTDASDTGCGITYQAIGPKHRLSEGAASANDAELIAAARNALPALIAELRRLREIEFVYKELCK